LKKGFRGTSLKKNYLLILLEIMLNLAEQPFKNGKCMDDNFNIKTKMGTETKHGCDMDIDIDMYADIEWTWT
jgi:hypothetical protein